MFLPQLKKNTTFVFMGIPGENSIRWPPILLFWDLWELGMWSLWADEIWLGKSGWVGEMMASTYKGKNKNQRPQALLGGLILTASSRNNELTLDSLQSPTSYSSCPGSISLSGPGKWGWVSGCSGSGWTASEPLNAFQLLRFWANCFACPFLEGSLKKNKKGGPLSELVSISFA